MRQQITPVAYYDKKQPGAARFLRDPVLAYPGMKK